MFILLSLLIGSNVTLVAQTQYISLCNSNNSASVNYAVRTNDVIQYVGGNSSTVKGITPSSGAGGITLQQNQPDLKYTGFTNINLTASAGALAYATIAITPATPPVVIATNYLPADCVMIPSSAAGNCNVILESTSDFINWTAASPGLYGPGSATNRFFRVRISCQ